MKQTTNTPRKNVAKTKSRLSNTKAKEIENGFIKIVEATRDVYLRKELDKYKNIKVIYG